MKRERESSSHTAELKQMREGRIGRTLKCGKNQLAGTYSSKKEGVKRKDVTVA
jgi:hypothetical protein